MATNKAPAVVASLTVEIALAMILVAGRVYVRAAIKGTFGIDDVILIIGFLLTLGFCIGMYICVARGYGRPATSFAPMHLVDIIKTELIAQTFAVVAFIPTKVAVGATMMRIFPGRILHGMLWFMMTTVFIIFALVAILDFVQCNPPEHMWNITVPAKCWDPSVYADFSIFSGEVWGALYDFMCAGVPWYFIPKLQMSKRDRIGLASAMSLGVFAGISALVKSAVLKNLGSRSDYAYDTVPVILWANTELVLTMIAVSIPLLKPLIQRRQGTTNGTHERPVHSDFHVYPSKRDGPSQLTPKALVPRSDSDEAILLERGLSYPR